jgi:hypothetical protein
LMIMQSEWSYFSWSHTCNTRNYLINALYTVAEDSISDVDYLPTIP